MKPGDSSIGTSGENYSGIKKGSLKEGAGKLTGDSKLGAEGKADKLGGKIQNAVGGIKDALKGK